jgi:hypothetical protein
MNEDSKIEYEKVLSEKFMCKNQFAIEIEMLVQSNEGMNYIDAICFFCEKNNFDLESIPKLISKPLKDKIKCDALELNFLRKTSTAKLIL